MALSSQMSMRFPIINTCAFLATALPVHFLVWNTPQTTGNTHHLVTPGNETDTTVHKQFVYLYVPTFFKLTIGLKFWFLKGGNSV